METLSFPSIDEQERILSEARNGCKKSAFQMRKAIEEDNMREALKFSSAMLGELRTSQLSPQKYYELYMQAFDQLVNLESFFGEERSKGRSYSELYELVQHAGNVLPRLYLMVAVGCLYIKSGEGKAREILKDLVEMCKGVQHPTRGLFLRSYLCQRSRGLLPDTGSPYEGAGGSITDALDFLLSNFIEMNKLWVRMQHQGTVRDKEKRERERSQLQDLVGKNLTYLSQLDGLHYGLYSTEVLPRVMEQIVSCRDDIAQQYLMQCVIQGFPDAFHLGTLDTLLAALPQLQPGVKVHAIMSSLMDRLAKYAQTDAAVLQQLLDMKAFERFRDAVARVLAAQGEMPAGDAVEMYVALMNFTGSVHPNIVANVNQVLAAAYTALSARGLAGDARAEKQLVSLLSLPLSKYDVVTGLGLTEYPLLMSLLRTKTHKELATRIVGTVLEAGTKISSVERVAMMFRFVHPLIADPEGSVQAEGLDDEDVEEEQILVARLLHNLCSTDPDEHFAILQSCYGHLVKGGTRRTRHTLPALAFCALQLERRVVASTAAMGGADVDEADSSQAAAHPKATPESILQWLLPVVLSLAEGGSPADAMTALRLLLAAATAASEEARLELLAYEFFEQAFTLYEEALPDQRLRITALQSIVGSLAACYVFGQENRDALVAAATSYSAKLLKRPDQCRAVATCSHLSWQDEPRSALSTSNSSPPPYPPVRDSAKVLACLSRAIKVANAVKQQAAAARPASVVAASSNGSCSSGTPPSHVRLYIDILGHYLHYYERGVEAFTPSAVQGILDLITAELGGTSSAAGASTVANAEADTRAYWRSTLAHIQRMAASGEGPGVRERFAALKL